MPSILPEKTIKENLRSGLFCGTAVLPLAVAFCVCSASGADCALATGILFSILTAFTGYLPSFVSFAVIAPLVASHGIYTAMIAIAVALVLYLIGHFSAKTGPVFDPESPGIAAVLVGTAFVLTVLQTTNYFGIGATGNSMMDMFKSYSSLGFHPNWRGVLYGTITMVLMITYPRKMKTLSKEIPGPFWAILFTTIITFFLNPAKESTAITEIGAYSLFDFSSLDTSVDAIGIISALLCGIALFFVMMCRDYTGKGKCEYYGNGRITDKLITAAVSIVVCFVALLPLNFFTQRIPVHSLAVIIIVGMWQKVNWHAIKVSFTGGLSHILLFFTTLLILLFVSEEYGIILAEIWTLAGIRKDGKSEEQCTNC